MGCNCKKNLKKMEKYSDDYGTSQKDNKFKLLWLQNLINYLLQIVIVIFAIGVFIIISPMLLVFVLVCAIIGKTPKIVISNLIKRTGR